MKSYNSSSVRSSSNSSSIRPPVYSGCNESAESIGSNSSCQLSNSKKVHKGFHASFEHLYSPKPFHRVRSTSDLLPASPVSSEVEEEDSGCESSTSDSSSSSITCIPIKRSSFENTSSSYYRKISRNELKHIESRINVENHKREQQLQQSRRIRI